MPGGRERGKEKRSRAQPGTRGQNPPWNGLAWVLQELGWSSCERGLEQLSGTRCEDRLPRQTDRESCLGRREEGRAGKMVEGLEGEGERGRYKGEQTHSWCDSG